jgi:carboxymethylenebutenolidase
MTTLSPAQAAMPETFRQHMTAEITGDIETAMGTMTDDPYVNNVPVMTGGAGREGVRRFYSDHLVGKFFPPDTEMVTVSRTVGEGRLVEELVIKFAHTVPIEWMLPGIPPAGNGSKRPGWRSSSSRAPGSRASASTGTRPRCWCSSGCSTRPGCR